MTATLTRRTSLASSPTMQDGGVIVDFENGIIRNCALITKGTARPCNAEAFEVDAQTLADTVRLVNAEPGGLRTRLSHPEVDGRDGIGLTIGSLKNARLVGDSARVDFHIGSYAQHMPGGGDVRAYLLALAKEQPTHLGLSVVIDAMSVEDDGKGSTRARFHRLFAGDIVGEPGGNPRGLLSRSPESAALAGGITMTEAQLEYLRSLGLPADATEAEATAFAEALDTEQRTKFAEMASVSEDATKEHAAASADANRTMLSKSQIREINDLAKLSDLGGDWAMEQIIAGRTPSQARAAAMAARAEKQGTDSVRTTPRANVSVGTDLKRESLSRGIADAILMRSGGEKAVRKPHERSREFMPMRLLNMAREFFGEIGLGVRQMSDPDVAMLALSSERQRQYANRTFATAGDYSAYYNTFANVLYDAQNKALQLAYAETQPKWPLFCTKATARDFKQVARPQLNAMPQLVSTTDGDVVSYATIGDSKEVYTLLNYTAGWVLTWKNMVNDDLDAFGKLPRMAAHKASQKQDYLAFLVLSSNPLMADGAPLFSFAHSNVIYAGSTPSLAQIQLMQAKAQAQTAYSDDASDPLDLELGVLIVPSALGITTKQLATSAIDPASSGAAGNPIANEFTVVSSARLTGNPWYGAVRPGTLCETIELCFLEGFEAPRVDTTEDFDAIAQKSRLYQPLFAKALDWRGLVKNMGAATSASLT